MEDLHVKIDLKEIRCEGLDQVHLAWIGTVCGVL
jgi:hypothetical protein